MYSVLLLKEWNWAKTLLNVTCLCTEKPELPSILTTLSVVFQNICEWCHFRKRYTMFVFKLFYVYVKVVSFQGNIPY